MICQKTNSVLTAFVLTASLCAGCAGNLRPGDDGRSTGRGQSIGADGQATADSTAPTSNGELGPLPPAAGDSAKLGKDARTLAPDTGKPKPPPVPGHEAGPPPIVVDQGVPPPPTSTAICGGAAPGNQTWVTGTTYYPVQEIPRPGKCATVADPVFHTTIARVSDKATDGYSDASMENEYAKMDPENSAGTLLVLRGESGTYHLYDLPTFKRLAKLNMPTGNQEPEPRWDAVNPKLLYHLSNMKLMALNTDTNTSSVVHDFSADVAGGATISTGVEGDASVDRRYWCFMVQSSGGSVTAIVSYDRIANAVVGKLTSFADSVNWLGTSMSGAHCVIGWNSKPVTAYPLDFSKAVSMPTGANGHADLALTAAGKDVLAYQNNATDWIAIADLDTGAETNLVPIPFSTNTDIGMHFSGNAAKTPGWVLVATYGSQNPPSGKSHSWMDTSLFLVELKATPRVVRVANTHAYISVSPSGSKNYFAEAYAAINTRGNRIYWGSNWGQTDLTKIETFVAELPEQWPTLVPP